MRDTLKSQQDIRRLLSEGKRKRGKTLELCYRDDGTGTPCVAIESNAGFARYGSKNAPISPERGKC
jgi:hypothetical protein